MNLFADLSHNRHCLQLGSNSLNFNDIRIFSWNLLKHSDIHNISFSTRRLIRKAKCWSRNLVNFAQSIEVPIDFFDIGRRLSFEDIKSTINLLYYPFKIRRGFCSQRLYGFLCFFVSYCTLHCKAFVLPTHPTNTSFQSRLFDFVGGCNVSDPHTLKIFELNDFPVYAQVLRHN